MIDLDNLPDDDDQFKRFISQERLNWFHDDTSFCEYLNSQGVMHPTSEDARWTPELLQAFLPGPG